MEVLNPSKKWTKGRLARVLARWATKARSMTSCTDAEASKENPVSLTALMSLWSPKIERAWAAIARAAT